MTFDESHTTQDSPESTGIDPVAALLQRALAEPPEPQIRFLPGIKERIRQRTRGRYFGRRREVFRDPMILMLMAAILVLLMGAVIYVVLEPLLSPGVTAPHDP